VNRLLQGRRRHSRQARFPKIHAKPSLQFFLLICAWRRKPLKRGKIIFTVLKISPKRKKRCARKAPNRDVFLFPY